MKLHTSVRNWALAQVRNWPTLYVHQTEELSILSTLDHIFYTLGNGYNWRNGKPVEICPESKGYEKLEQDRIEMANNPNMNIPPIYCCGAFPAKVEDMNLNWINAFIWTTDKYIELGISGVYNPASFNYKWNQNGVGMFPDRPDFYDLKNEPDPLEAYLTRLKKHLDRAKEARKLAKDVSV